MTAQTPAILKTYFNTGDRPTEQQFANLIDSSVNVATTSAQVITADVSALGKLTVVGNVIVSGSITPNHTFGIVGTTTNDPGASGSIGEHISSAVSMVNAGSSTQFSNITSISLTAGDWDVTGQILPILNSATLTSGTWDGCISLLSGNNSSDIVVGDNYLTTPTNVGANTAGITISSWRVSIASATTVYLKGRIVYSAGTPQYYGRLSARRVR